HQGSGPADRGERQGRGAADDRELFGNDAGAPGHSAQEAEGRGRNGQTDPDGETGGAADRRGSRRHPYRPARREVPADVRRNGHSDRVRIAAGETTTGAAKI